MAELPRKKASVGFADVEVIELAMVPGENHPSQVFQVDENDENDSRDVPTRSQLKKRVDSAHITLDWQAQSRTRIDLDTYEENKRKKLRMGKKLRRMSRSVRKRILRNIGVETSDIESEDESRAERRKKKKKKRNKGEKKKTKARETGRLKFNPFGNGALSPTRPADRFASGGASLDFHLSKMDAAPKAPLRGDDAPGVPRRRNSLDVGPIMPVRKPPDTPDLDGNLSNSPSSSSHTATPQTPTRRIHSISSYSPPPSSSSRSTRSSIGHAIGAMVKQPARLAKYTTKKVGKMVSSDKEKGSRFADYDEDNISSSGRSMGSSEASRFPRPPIYKSPKVRSPEYEDNEGNQSMPSKPRSNSSLPSLPPLIPVATIDESSRTSGSVETLGAVSSSTSVSVLTSPTYMTPPKPGSQRSALRSSRKMKTGKTLPNLPIRSGASVDGSVSLLGMASVQSRDTTLNRATFEDERSIGSNDLSEWISPEFEQGTGSMDASSRSRRSVSRSSISSVTSAIGALAKQPVKLVKFTSKKSRRPTHDPYDLDIIDPPSSGRQRSLSMGASLDASTRTSGSAVSAYSAPESTSTHSKRERRSSISSVTSAIGSIVKKRSSKKRGSKSSMGTMDRKTSVTASEESVLSSKDQDSATPQLRRRRTLSLEMEDGPLSETADSVSPRRKSTLENMTSAIGSAAKQPYKLARFTAKQPYKLARFTGKPFRKSRRKQHDSIDPSNADGGSQVTMDSQQLPMKQLPPQLPPIADNSLSSRDMSSDIKSRDVSLKKEERIPQAIPPDVTLRSAITEISQLGDDTLRGVSLRQYRRGSSNEEMISVDSMPVSESLVSETQKSGLTRLSDPSVNNMAQLLSPRRVSMTGEIHLSQELDEIGVLDDSDSFTYDVLNDEKKDSTGTDSVSEGISLDTHDPSLVKKRTTIPATVKGLSEGNDSKTDGISVLTDDDERKSMSLRSSLSLEKLGGDSLGGSLASPRRFDPYGPNLDQKTPSSSRRKLGNRLPPEAYRNVLDDQTAESISIGSFAPSPLASPMSKNVWSVPTSGRHLATTIKTVKDLDLDEGDNEQVQEIDSQRENVRGADAVSHMVIDLAGEISTEEKVHSSSNRSSVDQLEGSGIISLTNGPHAPSTIKGEATTSYFHESIMSTEFALQSGDMEETEEYEEYSQALQDTSEIDSQRQTKRLWRAARRLDTPRNESTGNDAEADAMENSNGVLSLLLEDITEKSESLRSSRFQESILSIEPTMKSESLTIQGSPLGLPMSAIRNTVIKSPIERGRLGVQGLPPKMIVRDDILEDSAGLLVLASQSMNDDADNDADNGNLDILEESATMLPETSSSTTTAPRQEAETEPHAVLEKRQVRNLTEVSPSTLTACSASNHYPTS